MAETVFAVLDADGVVVNKILAGQEFVDSLLTHLADDDIDTGDYDANNKFVDVSDRDPQPGVGWTRAKNGKFVAPPEIEPTPEEIAAREQAEQAAAAAAADAEFRTAMQDKLRIGGKLTQDERDRLLALG